ncbi:MAG: hypothetical protein R3E86_12360 [Pseudomonadales bacterium]
MPQARTLPSKPRLAVLSLLTCVLASSCPGAQAAGNGAYIAASDKGGFQYSEPAEWPRMTLDLDPIERQVAEQASTRCATPLAAAPLDLGESASFMEKAAGKAAGAAIGALVGGFLGGGGKQREPELYRDPIKNKFKEKFTHPTGDARLRIGGQLYGDGMLISARVDDARGKGTFHTMFLERPDCTRIFPEQYQGYGLWGSWSLSVSVTKTTSHYRNGDLVDRSVSRSGWSRSGTFDFSRGFSLWDDQLDHHLRLLLDPDDAYLAQLRREIGTPAWQEMGFGEPMQGIREAGAVFRVAPADLTPGTIAVVHITNVEKGRYHTLGFPLRFQAGEEGRLTFSQLDAVAP